MNERVLIVDDEEPIRRSLARLLAFSDYEVVQATNGDEALKQLAAADTAVLLTDYHMPGLGVEHLLRQARDISPDTSRILFSGHVDVEVIRSVINNSEVHRFITKPWNDEELLLAVRHGVERAQLMRHNRHLRLQSDEQNRELKRFNADLEHMVDVRTEALALRNRALVLSQEVLDRLPVAVIGIDPGAQVALVNALARTFFPNLMPGDALDAVLPREFAQRLRSGIRDDRSHPSALTLTGHGPLQIHVTALGERGSVMTLIPVATFPDDAIPAGTL